MIELWCLAAVLVLAAAALSDADKPEVPTYDDPTVQGVQEHLNRLCDEHAGRLAAIETEVQLAAEGERARRRFLRLLDLDLDAPRSVPPSRPVGTLEASAYRIEKVVLETAPGVPVPCSIYVPAAGPVREPALLVTHGHSGRDRPVYQNGYQRLAKAGFLVLAKDGWGKGERRGTSHGPEGGQLFLSGASLMGLELWDNVRCLDYLLSRPDVDPERLGMTGLSGGGSQTLYTAAIDPRLRAASPVCAVTTFQADLGDTTMCVCELLADILTVGDHSLFLAMAYPQPALVVNGVRDPIFPIAGTRAAVRQARRLYGLGGHADRLRLAEFDTAHDWSDAMLSLQVGWFREQFGLPPLPDPPAGDGPRSSLSLDCYPDGELPPGSLTLGALNRARIERSLAERGALVPAQDAACLAGMVRERWSGEPIAPVEVVSQELEPDPGRFFRREELAWLSSLGGEVRAALTHPPEGEAAGRPRVVLRLDRDRQVPQLERLYWEDRIRTHAVVLELAYTGSSLTPVQEGQVGTALLASGRSLLAERVRDLLVALEVLRGRSMLPEEAELTLTGHGFDGVLLLFAAPFLAQRARLVLDRTPISYLAGPEPDFTTSRLLAPPAHWTLLPGLALRHDLSDLLALAAPRPILLAHPLDAAQEAMSAEDLAALLRRRRHPDWSHVEAVTREAERREVFQRLSRMVTG